MSHTSIEDRLNFYNLSISDKDFSAIAKDVSAHGPRALGQFYAKIARTPAVASFFPTKADSDRAGNAQLDHWLNMFRNGLGDNYVKNAHKIGMVHARIGLEPQWYIGGYANILTTLITAMIAGGAKGLIPGNAALARRVTTLIRVALLDMDIALSTYFVKAEEDVRTAMVGKIGAALEALADGDLTARASGLPEAYQALEQNFNGAIRRLNESMQTVATATNSITTGAQEIRTASDDLARRTEQQAASLEESAAALSQINEMAKQSAQDINGLNGAVARVHADAVNGADVVSAAVTAMGDIQTSAHSIAQIIEMIDSIAFQTNLLALNAGVEAARVGAEGQGFAVVANEVRALAQRSAGAADEIKALVQQSLSHVDNGVQLVADAGNVLNGIMGRMSEISDAASRVAETAASQSTNLSQINDSVTEMDRVTQQNAAMVEQTNAAARTMANEVSTLGGIVSQFRCQGSPGVAALSRAA